MNKMTMVTTWLLTTLVLQPTLILASDDTRKMPGQHMHGSLHGDSTSSHERMQSKAGTAQEMFLVKKEVDGFVVKFHVMKAKDGMQHGGSHNVMVNVEKDGEVMTDLVVNLKVTHPNQSSESKMMMKMGDWHIAGYDLGHQGEHQLMAIFKTAEGKEHIADTPYTEHQSAGAHDE